MSLADEEEDDTNALEATPASATEVIPDASQRTGLNAGDVVALVRVRPGHDGGVPMRVVAESREDEGGEERQSWSLVELGDEDVDDDDDDDGDGTQTRGGGAAADDSDSADMRPWENDRAYWLEVVRKDKWIGFRSQAAGGRFLQVRRRGRRRLSFFNTNFGVWEQFEFAHGEPRISWNRAKMFFRSRQLTGFVLTVEVVRVGADRRQPNSTPRSGVPGGLALPDSAAAEESVHGSVFRAMGSILAKEWSSFAQREVASRASIERELRELNENLLETRGWATAYVADMRQKLQHGVNECLREVNSAYTIVERTKTSEEASRRDAGALRELAVRLLAQRKTRNVLTKAFSCWKALSQRDSLCKRFEAIIATKRVASVMRSALRQWYDCTSRTLFLQRQLERGTRRYALRLTVNCFRGWADCCAGQSAAAKTRATRAAAFNLMSTSRRVFEEWTLWVAERKARHEHFLFALTSNARTRLGFILREWRGYVHGKGTRRRHEAFVSRRSAALRMRQLLAQWSALRGAEARERRAYAMADSRFSMSLMTRSVIAWALFARGECRRKYVLGKYLVRSSSRRLLLCFTAWKRDGPARRERLSSAYRVVGLLVSRTIADAFSIWRRAVLASRKHGSILGLVQRLSDHRDALLLRRTFGAWAQALGSTSTRTVTVDGAVRKMAKKRLQYTFVAWHLSVVDARRIRQLVALAVAKLSRKVAAIALQAFAYNVHHAKRDRTIVHRMEMRRSARLLGFGFAQWNAVLEDSRERRQRIAERILMHAMTTTRIVFTAWRNAVREDTEDVVIAGDALVRNLRTRMRRLMTSRCFTAWSAYARHQSWLRASVRRMVVSWQNQNIRKAFAAWMDYTSTRRRHRSIVSSALVRMRMRLVGSAFVTWFESARDAAISRRRLEAFVHRWLNALTSRAFEAWLRECYAKAEARRIATECMIRMNGNVLQNAMLTWRENASLLGGRRELLQRFTRRMRAVSVVRAFNSWLSVTMKTNELRDRNLRFLLNIRARRNLRQSFERLREITRTLSFARGVCEDAFSRRLISNLRVALGAWATAAAHERIRRERLQAIVTRMRYRNMATAFESWLELVVSAREVKAILADTMGKMMHRTLYASWNTWVHVARESKHYRTLVTKAVSRLSNRMLSGAFFKWKEDVRFERRTRVIIERWTGRSRRALLAGTVECWLQAVSLKRRIEAVSAKALRRVVFGSMSTAFSSWSGTVASLRRGRETAEASFRRKAVYTMSRVFTAFCSTCREQRRKATLLMQVCRRIQRMSSATYFREWHTTVRLRQWYEMKLAQKKARDRRRQLTLVLVRWKECMAERAEQLQTVSVCVKRKQTAQRFFLSWYWDAFDSDIQSALSEFMQTRDVTLEHTENGGSLPNTVKDLQGMITPLPMTQPSFDISSGLGSSSRLASRAMDDNDDDDEAQAMTPGSADNKYDFGQRANWNRVTEITI